MESAHAQNVLANSHVKTGVVHLILNLYVISKEQLMPTSVLCDAGIAFSVFMYNDDKLT